MAVHSSTWELRCRFLVALTWILGIGAMQHRTTVMLSGLLLLLMLLGRGVSLRRTFRNLLIVSPFLAVSFVTLLFSDGFPVTREASDFAFLIVARMAACILAVGLVSGDEVHDYLDAFHALRFPDALSSTLFLTQRYVHVIGRQFSATAGALASRLFTPGWRWKTFEIYGRIIGSLAIHAIDRSEHVHKAMESRGFHGRVRTFPPKPIRWTDVLKTAAAILLLAVILFAERRCFA